VFYKIFAGAYVKRIVVNVSILIFYTQRATIFMKHQLIPFGKPLTCIAISLLLTLSACQNGVDTPSLSCPEMKMTAAIDGRSRPMSLSNSILFRKAEDDEGGEKFFSMEAISDTFKIVLNLTDRAPDATSLKNDSLRLDTFFYSRTGPIKGGLVAASIIDHTGNYNTAVTDTSYIIIKKVNTRNQTISGSFFFMADNLGISGEGAFENACYVSLQ